MKTALACIITDYESLHKALNPGCAACGMLARYQANRLTVKDTTALSWKIEGMLSPENLHADGEISRKEAAERYRFLRAAERELEAIKARGVAAAATAR